MSDILDTLKKHDFMFKKKFGQNFITDTNLLDAIVTDAGIESDDEVLEIGTGAGTLTKALAKRCKKVLTIEIDNNLRPILSENFSGIDNIELCFADFMKVPVSEINNHFSKPFKVVANLPYYITTPIIFRLIEENFNVTSITIMVQKEVADRLSSESGTKDYGSITVQLDAISNVSTKRVVSKNMFTPAPKIDSAIVRIDLDRNKYKITNKQVLVKTIESAFSMRRKTLSNCLKSKLNLSQEQIDRIYDNLEFHPQIRGEVLSTSQFVDLANEITQELTNQIIKNDKKS